MDLVGNIKGRLRFVAAITLFIVLITAITVYSTALSDEVEIHCDGKVIVVDRTSKSVFHVLRSEGISIGVYDSVTPGLDVQVEDADRIVVKRAVNVTLTENGETKDYMTSTDTVADFLKAKGKAARSYDLVTPALDTSITEGMQIDVIRGERVVKTDVVDIPYETEKHENENLPKDLISVTRYGEVGSRTVTTEYIYREGMLVSETVIGESITKQPVTEILDIGTKPNTIVTPDGKTYTYSKVITCTATAYDASYESNGPWGPITATGKALASGMVAVDPRVIPLGTKLYIEAPDGSWVYGYSVAEDTGGAIKGNKVDLFFPSSYKVRQFGRRTANVYILD
ncbi:MAG: DUF348 domain-containing protein [Clostridia bacterium]|nr:DUF348 domain-containing protein [Clostridia bacterium]